MTDAAPLPPVAPLAGAPPRLRRFVVVSAIGLAVIGAIGTALSPWLLVEHPLILVALNPDGRHIALGAAETDFLPLALVGTARRVLGLLATYGVGALYGHATIAWTERRFPRVARMVLWFERQLSRWGAPALVLMPAYTMSMLAGGAGLPLRRFLPAVTLGAFGWIGATILFGDLLSGWTQILLGWLRENLVLATAVCVALVLAQQLLSRRRGDSPIPPLNPPG